METQLAAAFIMSLCHALHFFKKNKITMWPFPALSPAPLDSGWRKGCRVWNQNAFAAVARLHLGSLYLQNNRTNRMNRYFILGQSKWYFFSFESIIIIIVVLFAWAENLYQLVQYVDSKCPAGDQMLPVVRVLDGPFSLAFLFRCSPSASAAVTLGTEETGLQNTTHTHWLEL